MFRQTGIGIFSGQNRKKNSLLRIFNFLNKINILSKKKKQLGGKSKKTKQAKRRAAAETAARKLFEHLIHSLYDKSRHHQINMF